MNWKSTVLISGAGLVGTWLMSLPAVAPTTTATRPATATPAAAPVQATDIQHEADRLAARVHAGGPLGPSTRNPFQFVVKPVPAPASAPVVSLPRPVSVSVAPVGPRVSLVGVASDVVDGVSVRSAILSVDGVVTIVKAGDDVGGLFRVETVDPEVVDLQRTGDGSRLTLLLGH